MHCEKVAVISVNISLSFFWVLLRTFYCTSMHHTLVVNASELAAVCGMHPYKSRDEALPQLVAHNSWLIPHLHEAGIEPPASPHKSSIEQALCETAGVGAQCSDEVVSFLHSRLCSSSSSATTLPPCRKTVAQTLLHVAKTAAVDGLNDQEEERSKKALESTLDAVFADAAVPSARISRDELARVRTDLGRALEQDTRVLRGTVLEKSAIERAEKALSITTIKRGEPLRGKVLLSAPGPDDSQIDILLRGKIDGIDDDGNIYESKNRRNRFFNAIPEYEKIQMEAYMFIYDKSTCTFLQNYNGEQRSEVYTSEPVLLCRIKAALTELSAYLVAAPKQL